MAANKKQRELSESDKRWNEIFERNHGDEMREYYAPRGIEPPVGNSAGILERDQPLQISDLRRYHRGEYKGRQY